MPKVIAQQVELDLTLDQVLTVVHQLRPEEQEIIRRAIEPPAWNQRLEELLARVWARVERYPITEEEIDAEVELARTATYAQNFGCSGVNQVVGTDVGGSGSPRRYGC